MGASPLGFDGALLVDPLLSPTCDGPLVSPSPRAATAATLFSFLSSFADFVLLPSAPGGLEVCVAPGAFGVSLMLKFRAAAAAGLQSRFCRETRSHAISSTRWLNLSIQFKANIHPH